MDTTLKAKAIIWHPHSERPVYEPYGDNRLITCLNMQRMKFGAMDATNIAYVYLNQDGSINDCADTWHSERWLRKAAIPWELLYPDTWWTYARDIIPQGI